MAEFEVLTVELDDVLAHDNADLLEIAVIGGYRSIVGKGSFKKGDLAIYVPEGAVLPEWVLSRENLIGKLAGGAKNRVKAIKLRGVLSQGLTLDPNRYQDVLDPNTGIGVEVSAELGVIKHEPVLPAGFSGDLKFLPSGPIHYDIENVKKRGFILQDGDLVVLTEKLHGTFCQIGWVKDSEPDDELFGDGRVYISSKGLGGRGLVFKNNEANVNNLYVRTAGLYGVLDRIATDFGRFAAVRLFGEIFGDVQDLKYGMEQGEVMLRLFDIQVTWESSGESSYCSYDVMRLIARDLGLGVVPEVARGSWADIQPDLESYTRGKSLLAPAQIREGVVIKAQNRQSDPRYGRLCLKSVSEDYLLRKGEVTELA